MFLNFKSQSTWDHLVLDNFSKTLKTFLALAMFNLFERLIKINLRQMFDLFNSLHFERLTFLSDDVRIEWCVLRKFITGMSQQKILIISEK